MTYDPSVIDITPPHLPIAVAKDMMERAPKAVAAVAALVEEDGTLWYDCAGYKRKDVLWALQKMIFEIMEDTR